MHFKVMGGTGTGPCCNTSHPPFLCLWNQNPARHGMYILTGKVGNLCYLFYRSSQFYDLRIFLPFNWKKMKNCRGGSRIFGSGVQIS